MPARTAAVARSTRRLRGKSASRIANFGPSSVSSKAPAGSNGNARAPATCTACSPTGGGLPFRVAENCRSDRQKTASLEWQKTAALNRQKTADRREVLKIIIRKELLKTFSS